MKERGHFLPHRAVVKLESVTTPMRPVFDASCRMGRAPSLNDCLFKGENFILLIPEVLLRFREKSVGFTADIRKAFQMIIVEVPDRNFLRFLWWKDESMNEIAEYRHARVPFGVTCSPFILGAVLEHHLMILPEELKIMGGKLLSSFYVDNCVGSEDTVEGYYEFRRTATEVLKEACMELRMWTSNVDEITESSTRVDSVLGLKWDKVEDTLFVDTVKIKPPEKVTKRTVLSTLQQVFDPIGFTSPFVIPIKILLQRTWMKKHKWDEQLPEDDVKLFFKWCEQLKKLELVRIPRVVTVGNCERSSWSLHTFGDASRSAYAAVVYLRVESECKVSVQLLAVKSRVSPIGCATIPRLELLGSLIGSRLASMVKKALSLEVKEYYWTDSTTVLAWIRRNDQWGTFVGNRINEILNRTSANNWKYVPGEQNPVDLHTRGCSVEELIDLI